MSANPTAPELALQRFRDEGYTISVVGQHLLVHDIPYLGQGPVLKRGILITHFIVNGDLLLPPSTHQVWFQGEFPCLSTGLPFETIGHPNKVGEIAPGVSADYYFSCKPLGWSCYATHFDQIQHYMNLLTFQAHAIDPTASASTRRSAQFLEVPSVFRYPDAASLRGAYAATSDRLALKKVAIVGVGGTGSYVLDQVAKTPTWEIHLFDGDVFELHNAFRAPGAAKLEDFGKSKVSYFASQYDPMHMGLVEHPYNLIESNINELAGFDFVFLCIDNGPARQMISGFLRQNGIPFVDCGMDLKMDQANSKGIFGQCRITFCTPQQQDHFDQCAPFMEEGGDAMYSQNIQVADMNAINAMMAVIRWKQYFGFYVDQSHPHQQVYTVNLHSLTRSVPNQNSRP